MRTGGAVGCGDGGGSRAGGEEAAPPEPGLLVGQIRRYKANKEVMEKAAEVYARLKSRVLGPKIEAIQKATRTGPEKAEEILAGEEGPAERAEDEASTGEELAGGAPSRLPRWRHLSALAAQAGCVPKAAGVWATRPCAAHRLHPDPQSQVAGEAVCVWPGARAFLGWAVAEVWEGRATGGLRGARASVAGTVAAGTGERSFLLGSRGPGETCLEQPLRPAPRGLSRSRGCPGESTEGASLLTSVWTRPWQAFPQCCPRPFVYWPLPSPGCVDGPGAGWRKSPTRPRPPCVRWLGGAGEFRCTGGCSHTARSLQAGCPTASHEPLSPQISRPL